MNEVFDALRLLGAKIEDTGGKLPAVISGPLRPGKISVATHESTQFASAMILLGQVLDVEVECPSTPYVEMTRLMLQQWGESRSIWEVEMDASSASYFIALQRLHPGGELEFTGKWEASSAQMDAKFSSPYFWPPPARVSRKTDLGDSIMTLVVSAAGIRSPLQLVDASNMRKQECDRLSALRVELSKCGVPVEEEPNGLTLQPTRDFRAAQIHTYQDHRMAMCFSVLGSLNLLGKSEPWLAIEDPGCVSKTFPNFFEVFEDVARQSYHHANRPYRPVVLGHDLEPVFLSKEG
jgi:3-phosphoshikimate 1-carboxyvinyltransferase